MRPSPHESCLEILRKLHHAWNFCWITEVLAFSWLHWEWTSHASRKSERKRICGSSDNEKCLVMIEPLFFDWKTIHARVHFPSDLCTWFEKCSISAKGGSRHWDDEVCLRREKNIFTHSLIQHETHSRKSYWKISILTRSFVVFLIFPSFFAFEWKIYLESWVKWKIEGIIFYSVRHG